MCLVNRYRLFPGGWYVYIYIYLVKNMFCPRVHDKCVCLTGTVCSEVYIYMVNKYAFPSCTLNVSW